MTTNSQDGTHLGPTTPHELPISVVILTLNEEANIGRCLENVACWAKQIFIVDSGSTDLTLDIARPYADEIVVHNFTSQAEQFNWALDHLPIGCPWVLRLDADEFLLPELWDEISRVLATIPEQVSGLMMKRRVYFQGRWIRHGGYYPTWLLRLFRHGKGRSEQLAMDEHLVVTGGLVHCLEHDFVDLNRKGLVEWLDKHARYAAREAAILTDRDPHRGEVPARLLGNQPSRKRWFKGNVYAHAPLFARALAYFLYRYILRRGFLDGREGLVFHVLQGFWYRFYVDALVWEGQRGRGGSPGPGRSRKR